MKTRSQGSDSLDRSGGDVSLHRGDPHRKRWEREVQDLQLVATGRPSDRQAQAAIRAVAEWVKAEGERATETHASRPRTAGLDQEQPA